MYTIYTSAPTGALEVPFCPYDKTDRATDGQADMRVHRGATLLITLSGGLLDSKGYGIALTPGTPYSTSTLF